MTKSDPQSLNQRCADACRHGDIARVKECFASRIDPNETDAVSGRNWLHLSIWYPDGVGLLNWLLEQGVTVRAEG